MDSITKNPDILSGRITSVDVFRGMTMFLLIGESTRLYDHLSTIKGNSFMQFIGTQLYHHPWHGLNFWDLIQPFFMFIVGVAIPFAVANRIKKGDSDQAILQHALKRSFLLLFLGWALYCIEPGEVGFRFQDVLAQFVSKIFAPFNKVLFDWTGDLTVEIMTSLATWAALWYICYWLYKNRIFIKI